MKYSKEDLEETIRVWQPYAKRNLSLTDAEEITSNAVNLYKYLAELDRKYNSAKNPAA